MAINLQVTWNMSDGSTLQQTFGTFTQAQAAMFKAKLMQMNSSVSTTDKWKNAVSCIQNSDGATVSSDTPVAAATIINQTSTELLGV